MTICVSLRIRIDEAPAGSNAPELFDLARAVERTTANWAREADRSGVLGSLVDVSAHNGAWRGLVVRVNVPEFDDVVGAELCARLEDVSNGEFSGIAFDEVDVLATRPLS